MKVLFIGGTGVISSACSELCSQKGYDLYLLNRGNAKLPQSVNLKLMKGDIWNFDHVRSLLENHYFDVVVEWIGFSYDRVLADFDLFQGKIGQYILISSASVYQKPSSWKPVTEDTPINNPYWAYAQAKIKCEETAMGLYRQTGFPVTIVRPSHTYDKTKIPLFGGYTTIDRMLKGKKIIIHGDGTSLWTLTHHKDFAKGFIGLLGKKEAIGEAYHITSDEVLTWNQICITMAKSLGVDPNIIHIPSDFIKHFDSEWGDGLLGDKSHCMIFDNSKIKKLVPEFTAAIPFSQGVREITEWYLGDKFRQLIDNSINWKIDEIIGWFQKGFR
ncbi:MAG: NAD-dependent epimerase/dehydratase family protein [Ignavibacteriaceae bacterium]|nr:NAD-dependent epimerase/dehydratase family protein [Ignavibacteriaceae bacterium]